MSQYFRTLQRLEQQEAAEEPTVSNFVQPLADSDTGTTPGFPPATLGAPVKTIPAAGHASYARLLEDLRAKASDELPATIVVAGISGSHGVRQVERGLQIEASRSSFRLLLCEIGISDGRRVLRPHGDNPPGTASGPSGMDVLASSPIELSGNQSVEALKAWLREAGAKNDLVLIEAPPLSSSVDAALLARAGDGLVLIVESAVTTKEALGTAIERSRGAGCRVLGIVMVGSLEWQPRWLRRLQRKGIRA